MIALRKIFKQEYEQGEVFFADSYWCKSRKTTIKNLIIYFTGIFSMALLVTPLSYRGCLARTRDELRRVNSMARGTARVSKARNNHFSFPESSEAGNMDSALCLKLKI